MNILVFFIGGLHFLCVYNAPVGGVLVFFIGGLHFLCVYNAPVGGVLVSVVYPYLIHDLYTYTRILMEKSCLGPR